MGNCTLSNSNNNNNTTTRVDNGGGGNQAAIDCVSGDTVNNSLVTLGSAVTATAFDREGGANVAYSFAIADQGKKIVASAANLTIPDNCSRYIVTGTTNTAVKLPANPIEGQIQVIAFDGAQTPSVVANTGHTVRNAPTGAVAAGFSCEFTFNKAANGGVALAWYRTR